MNLLVRGEEISASGTGGEARPVPAATRTLLIDAGIVHITLQARDATGRMLARTVLPVAGSIGEIFRRHELSDLAEDIRIFVTGKFRKAVLRELGRGVEIAPPAAMWAAAQELVKHAPDAAPLAIVELSASGYLLLAVDDRGELFEDFLAVNPRCGAGSGVNLDRVLQKLGIARQEVDDILKDYLGAAGEKARRNINVRADRCGVFASSATISDKNQGIPLAHALATTIKSEVLKTCRRLPEGIRTVHLAGGIFRWRFARDCASDHFRALGVREVVHDEYRNLPLLGLNKLVDDIGAENFTRRDVSTSARGRALTLPSFSGLRQKYGTEGRYLRLPAEAEAVAPDAEARLARAPLYLALDVGSTMAKVVITDAETGELLFLGAWSNSGDTVQTIKSVFGDLAARAGSSRVNVRHIGITGSARYQVQKVLQSIYPDLADRVMVLVENYAHARGSIRFAREHVRRLKEQGRKVNEDFCILVDIGGEDTKISTIALARGEMFDNAMNVKCSAGTGSLMDTLSALFGVEGGVAEACARAFRAERGHVINATCAVFLMENARRLQLDGVPDDEILASANWAIVENMARTLWNQIELPSDAVVLLHGQTMLSEPLPLAVTHRLQEHVGPSWALVPPHPGHRACFGLIRTMREQALTGAVPIDLQQFIDKEFQKRIIVCRAAACSDPGATCNRSHLSSRDACGRRFSITLGGCTAINELLAAKREGRGKDKAVDHYLRIWEYRDSLLPRSEDPDRIVIPRSFVVSDFAGLFSALLEHLGLPVHVDNVREQDVVNGMPHFHIDTCAPHIGVVGQFLRLAREPHGVILAPQIGYIPADGKSRGRTCTINQGGLAVARNLALLENPRANIHQFSAQLRKLDVETLIDELWPQLQPVLEQYGAADPARFRQAAEAALRAHLDMRRKVADFTADIIEEAIDRGQRVALVIAREYILNPGIYDSHVGRLLRDKGIVAIPAHVLDVELDEDLGHLYWRNPHMIATLAKAFARNEVHRVVRQPRLAELFHRIESGEGPELMAVQVSTFQCGPDSVTVPLAMEMTQDRPYLFIQSDSVIRELAHLENRVNTYVQQVEQGLHRELKTAGKDMRFEVRSLDRLIHDRDLDPARDVIAVPTVGDNRPVTAALRAAGFTVIENYEDETFSLEERIRLGRRHAGDAVCAPMAAIYGDVMNAVDVFRRAKEAGDPALAGKERLLIVNNKGSGPCRQGQYVETHKLLLNRLMQAGDASGRSSADVTGAQSMESALVRFLVAHEDRGFNVGLPEWTWLRAIQGAVLQGVLHRLLANGGAVCRGREEFDRFLTDYRALKRELFDIIEKEMKPAPLAERLVGLTGRVPLLGMGMKYLAWDLGGRKLRRPLRRFVERWFAGRQTDEKGLVRIHIDGEAYMRVAQFEDIFRALISTLGLGKFALDYTPLWTYLDYLIAWYMQLADEQLALARAELANPAAPHPKTHYRRQMREARRSWRRMKMLRFALRDLIAAPLYRAAGIEMPAPMWEALEHARAVLPTRRPTGELGPYIGEVLHKLEQGVDLVLNVAPEGCMVSSMGEVLTPAIVRAAQEASGAKGRIQHLFSQQGDVDEELLTLALLKTLGPRQFYQKAEQAA